MKDKMKKLTGLVSNAGKAAKDLVDNAIQIADQNDDGKFNLLNKYQVQTITKYGFNDEKYDEACILIESIKENK